MISVRRALVYIAIIAAAMALVWTLVAIFLGNRYDKSGERQKSSEQLLSEA